MPPPVVEPARHYLWPQNRLPWDIATACLTKLDVAPTGHVLGFNAEFLRWQFEIHEVPLDDEARVLRGVAVIEQFYAARLNAKASSDSGSDDAI